ncbi:uncharacterized protein LOC113901897 isoform X2 [Bos indicus x Bos taurus]|uniref:uncharacterized protein LOC113901897 isoform X2 n=1 Tax=Bos indicus x Bos taurus TaxID=30522 RepID=UPI000F7D1732|nr:uncharacterized protein LOC113901897 isoform X2 [Bos indicus x Bos taurus]
MGAHVHFARQLRVRRLGSHDQRNPSRDGWGGAVSSTSLPTQCQLPGPSVCVTVETVTVGARKWAEGSRVRAGAGVCPPSLPSSMATAGLGAMPRACGRSRRLLHAWVAAGSPREKHLIPLRLRPRLVALSTQLETVFPRPVGPAHSGQCPPVHRDYSRLF